MSIGNIQLTDDIGKRIKAYRKHKGWTLTQLSDIVNISQGSLSELETGKHLPRATSLNKIINFTDINAGWLLTGKGEMIDQKEFSSYEFDTDVLSGEPVEGLRDRSRFKEVPISDQIGAGNLVYFQEIEPTESTFVPTVLTELYPQMYYFRVEGWSMFPTVRPGAIVGINTEERNIVSGEMYGIWYDHEGASLKYIFAVSDKLIIKADNPQYPEDTKDIEELELNDRFIIGRLRYLSQIYK